MVTTTARDIGAFLEEQARKGEPITYGQVLDHFPDLPELKGAWLSHPLCDMFEQLDARITRLAARSEPLSSMPETYLCQGRGSSTRLADTGKRRSAKASNLMCG
jgi:hypothetical protein